MSIDLPTNIDSTYPDTGDPSRKVHQQQHDEIHQRLHGVIVYHGSTAGTARPVNATAVVWVGTVDPTNKAAGDLWYATTTDLLKRYSGSAWVAAGSGAYLAYLQAAMNPDLIIAGAITRDTNGAATSAPVTWPDGSTGTFTADTVSTAFPGSVDAYHVTKVTGGVTTTYTQAAVTRDASTGAVTNRPAMTVA